MDKAFNVNSSEVTLSEQKMQMQEIEYKYSDYVDLDFDIEETEEMKHSRELSMLLELYIQGLRLEDVLEKALDTFMNHRTIINKERFNNLLDEAQRFVEYVKVDANDKNQYHALIFQQVKEYLMNKRPDVSDEIEFYDEDLSDFLANQGLIASVLLVLEIFVNGNHLSKLKNIQRATLLSLLDEVSEDNEANRDAMVNDSKLTDLKFTLRSFTQKLATLLGLVPDAKISENCNSLNEMKELVKSIGNQSAYYSEKLVSSFKKIIGGSKSVIPSSFSFTNSDNVLRSAIHDFYTKGGNELLEIRSEIRAKLFKHSHEDLHFDDESFDSGSSTDEISGNLSVISKYLQVLLKLPSSCSYIELKNLAGNHIPKTELVFLFKNKQVDAWVKFFDLQHKFDSVVKSYLKELKDLKEAVKKLTAHFKSQMSK